MTPNLPNGEAPKGQQTKTPRRSADATGLSDSLDRFRSQSPQESLGLEGGSGLLKPFGLAAVVTAVLFAALTVGPYVVGKSRDTATSAPAKADTPDAGTPAPAKPDAPAAPGPDAGAKALPPVGPGAPGKAPPAKGDILEKLGENSSKAASPKVNPLDKKDDDLFKDIK